MNFTEPICLPAKVCPGEFFLHHLARINRVTQEIKLECLEFPSLLQRVVQSTDIAEDNARVFVEDRHGDRRGRQRCCRIQRICDLEGLMPLCQNQESNKGLGKPESESGKKQDEYSELGDLECSPSS